MLRNTKKYTVYSYLIKLGYSLSAENALNLKDSEFYLLKKYAEQVVSCSKNFWNDNKRKQIIEEFKTWGLL